MPFIIKRLYLFYLVLALPVFAVLVGAGVSSAQGPPPALVVTAPVEKGSIVPEVDFSGTVYYQEVSEVAAEVNGLVERVPFEEGDRVRKGSTLVKLSSDLLKKAIDATRARYDQVLTELEKAEIDLKRTKALFDKGLTSEKAYDDARLLAKGLENNAASLKAELEGLEVELEKKTIRAPFSGVVIEKHVERGEWVEPGSPVATLANIETLDVVVDVPQEVAANIREGSTVSIRSAGRTVTGRVIAVVPRGDVQTRTFPVKVRIKNDSNLMEGMEAVATLPRGEKVQALIVPRDAVIDKFGMTVVFAVVEGKAKMIPVQVAGFNGTRAGVRSEALNEGMTVVIKGNERLSDGQPVNVMGAGGAGGPDGQPGGKPSDNKK